LHCKRRDKENSKKASKKEGRNGAQNHELEKKTLKGRRTSMRVSRKTRKAVADTRLRNPRVYWKKKRTRERRLSG